MSRVYEQIGLAGWKQVAQINEKINRLKQISDMDYYNKPEFWADAEKAGDCEDLALAKRRLLVQAGWLGEDVRLVKCKQNNEWHIVLQLATTKGDYILDNLNNRILPWKQVPYWWHSRSKWDSKYWEDMQFLNKDMVHE